MRSLVGYRLPHPFFSDTMQAGVVSKRGNKYAQAYCTQYGWTRCYPIKTKSEAHEILSLVFKRDGVPPKFVVDNSKEQSLGTFAKKCRKADCHLTNTEPYSPWMQATEGCIKEVKRGLSRKMLRTGSPKRLWDHSLELEGAVCSHTCPGIFALDEQVPETVMMGGQTADISHLCEYQWFDWVMYYKPINGCPTDKRII